MGWSTPMVAFGRRDVRTPAFAEARAAAHRAGFIAVPRIVGGRAAALHAGSLVIDQYGSHDDPHPGWRERFERHTSALVRALATCEVDARVGEIAGEYCPGEFSVNARGAVKISGTAQRVTRRAWLVSSVVQVSDPEPLVAVLVDVYAALGLPFDPATFGSVRSEAAGVTPDEVRTAFEAAFSR
jgi:lipoate-protein ligase A